MISLGPLAECEACELVKVKVEGGTEWAIVGARDPGYRPLIFLTGKNAPFAMNIDPVPGNLETYPAAKYGTNYRFVHDPHGPCEIGGDDLSKAAGSLVLTDKGDWHLVVNKYNQAGLRWFDLKSGNELGDTGSHSIAFANWNLLIEGLKPALSEITLLSRPTQRRDA
jgi:hypothetical protein